MANDKLVLRVYIPEDRRLPDTATHIHRFQIKSESGSKLYTIAQSRSGLWWACSCPGFIGHGGKQCKHLRALGLPGYHQPFEATLPAASESK
jgi:hypothetical protein